MSKPLWTEFAVGKPSTKPNFVAPDCVPFSTVSHVAHVANAIGIARDGRLKPDLVYDKSKLNDSRITVNWLSPNDWNDGFRYGNVRFVFDWAKIFAVEGIRFYWVEVIDYQPRACRILATKTDHDADNRLVRYDPTLGDGPWWWDKTNNEHYRNGRFCLEIMIESGLGFRRCIQTDFVLHHPRQCCVDYKTCPDCGRSAESGGAAFLAAVVSAEIPVANLKIVPQGDRSIETTSKVWSAWDHLWGDLKSNGGYHGPVTSAGGSGESLVRAILGAFARKNDEDRNRLTALFESEQDLQSSFDRVFQSAFGKEFPRLNPEDFAF